MKKNKKFVAWALSITLGLGAIIGVPIIYKSSQKIVGTEAAKILLAREKMTTNSFNWEKIFTKATATTASYNIKEVSAKLVSQNENLGELVHSSHAGKVYKNNGEYNFQNISGASYQGLVVSSRLYEIDYRVENAAKNIHYLKNELNIVNKWVKDGHSKFYLDVTGSTETLLEYYEDKNGLKFLWVVERETREDSNSVYSLMYTDMGKGSLYNPVFLVYIPNERYEYYYGHEGNSTDYLIAENDKGYWNIFMPNENDYYNVTISEDFAFHSSGNYVGEGDDYGSISNTELDEDIISHYATGISLHLSAFNGVKGIFAKEDTTITDYYDGGTKSYISVDYLQKNKIEIRLNNGKVIKNSNEYTYGSKTIKIENMNLDFYTNPGRDPQYNATFSLEMGEGLTLKEKLNLLETFLTDNGLTCKYDLTSVEKCIIKNSEIANSLTSFYTWNGYLINSSENFKKAEGVIFDKINVLYGEYDKVKDAEVVNNSFFSAKVARSQTFAQISNLTFDSVAYSTGKVQINGAKVTVEKSKLFEENKKYKLQVGLARVDKNGKFLSQNTVNLKTTDVITSKTYQNDSLVLTATGEFEVPLALEENRYVVVVYAVTDDELIRVSEMKAIGFINQVNETIETDATKITLQTNNSNLTIEYTTKLYFNITISGDISYTSLRRKMMAEVLKHGYPMDNEEITNESDNSVTGGSISPGEYTLKFLITTIDGVVTAYVVCTVTA